MRERERGGAGGGEGEVLLGGRKGKRRGERGTDKQTKRLKCKQPMHRHTSRR